jgi:hypothetical protein
MKIKEWLDIIGSWFLVSIPVGIIVGFFLQFGSGDDDDDGP